MLICVECAMAHTNDDFTGMDADTEVRVRAGMDLTGPLVLTGDEDGFHEFSWHHCDGCGSTLGGSRYEAVAW